MLRVLTQEIRFNGDGSFNSRPHSKSKTYTCAGGSQNVFQSTLFYV